MGTHTPPVAVMPKSASGHSCRLLISTPTLVPGRTPSAMSPLASRRARSRSSAKDWSRPPAEMATVEAAVLSLAVRSSVSNIRYLLAPSMGPPSASER